MVKEAGVGCADAGMFKVHFRTFGVGINLLQRVRKIFK
jgi:hypothetical protein